MVWDETKPSGSEVLRFGDNRIRELKQDLENALQQEHYFPVDTNNVKLVPKIPIGTTSPSPEYVGRMYFNRSSNLQTFAIKTSTVWEIASNNYKTLPSGTRIVTNKTANFLRLHSMSGTFAVRLTNNNRKGYLAYYGGDSPTNFSHSHRILTDTNLNLHSHSFVNYTPQASGADYDSGGIFDQATGLAENTHVHKINFASGSVNLYHTHFDYTSAVNITFAHYVLMIFYIDLDNP